MEGGVGPGRYRASISKPGRRDRWKSRWRSEVARLFAEGSYAEIHVQRLTRYQGTLLIFLTRIPTVLAMFLLGLYVGKEGVLRDVEVPFWADGMALALPDLRASAENVSSDP